MKIDDDLVRLVCCGAGIGASFWGLYALWQGYTGMAILSVIVAYLCLAAGLIEE